MAVYLDILGTNIPFEESFIYKPQFELEPIYCQNKEFSILTDIGAKVKNLSPNGTILLSFSIECPKNDF